MKNPYEAALGGRNPLETFSETPLRTRALLDRWSDADFERRLAPGKWTMRQVLVHLAQTELALGTRLRYALTQGGYVAQNFSQDDWLPLDSGMDARTALDVYTSLRRMNIAMFRGLTPEQLERTFQHPEYGSLTVGWVVSQMAGHDLHHLAQFESFNER